MAVTAGDAIPPDWVPWHALLHWVVWIVSHYFPPEWDEATAKRCMPDVVLALRHDVDNRVEPRLGLWDHGRFVEEIDWLDNYVVENWSTGLVRRRVPRMGDPPTFILATHWAWLMAAVRQVALTKRPSESRLRQPLSEPPRAPVTTPQPAKKKATKKPSVNKGGGQYHALYKPAERYAKEVLLAARGKKPPLQLDAFTEGLRDFIAHQDGEQPDDKTIIRWAVNIFWPRRREISWLKSA